MSISDVKSDESVHFDELLANYCVAPQGKLVSRGQSGRPFPA